MIVVDASLAAKWFLIEADSRVALAFLASRDKIICGPAILAVEVSRAIVTAANTRRIGKPTARVILKEWLTAIDENRIPLHATHVELLLQAADLALDFGHPLADCLYLALALELGADLVTCDAKFHAKVGGSYPNVKLLADYGN